MKQPQSPSRRTANNAAPRWRAALDALIGAPVRLHRYRHMHAEVIEDALRGFDCDRRRGAGR
jgi:hypothetical protein